MITCCIWPPNVDISACASQDLQIVVLMCTVHTCNHKNCCATRLNKGESGQEVEPAVMQQMADTVLQLLDALLANLLSKVQSSYLHHLHHFE